MILAWVISLLLLCSATIVHLERLNAIRIMEEQTLAIARKHFIAAEKAVLECEQKLTTLHYLSQKKIIALFSLQEKIVGLSPAKRSQQFKLLLLLMRRLV